MLSNEGSIYRHKVWKLIEVRSTKSHACGFWLVFEATWTNMVSRKGRVVENFKHTYSDLLDLVCAEGTNTKLWKNMKFSTLRKISKFGKFDFSKWNLDLFISWWTSFICWHVLMNCDLWHLILTKKSKFDFSLYQLTFDQLTENQLSINWSWGKF